MADNVSVDKLIESCGDQAGLAVNNQTIICANRSFADLLGYKSPQSLKGLPLSTMISCEGMLIPGIRCFSVKPVDDSELEAV